MDSKKISNNMLARMPIYLNYIKALPKTTQNISATKIANALGFGEVSVRKDLAKISDGGRCKLGYNCEELINDIEDFLDIKKTMDAIIVGNRDMVKALLKYEGFAASGVNVIAGFDINRSREENLEQRVLYPIKELKGFCQENDVKMAILMSEAENAQDVCDLLVLGGVEAIWNFTPIHLSVPENVVVQDENITTSIIKLRMQMKEKSEVC